MKDLSTAVLAKIKEMGTEPVNILEVQWVTDGPFLNYGDKSLDTVDGVILSLSNLESVVKLDSQGRSQSITVTLDDTSGEIKDIINTNDPHGKTARLMQWFEGLPLSESFKLYEGEISSPIVWSEGDRTISFSVITKLADKEVGFSPEEGNFPFLVDRLVGKPWPMVFGIVQNVPAVRLQEVSTTQIAQDLGVVDPSIAKRNSNVGNQIGQLKIQLWFAQLARSILWVDIFIAGCWSPLKDSEACASFRQKYYDKLAEIFNTQSAIASAGAERSQNNREAAKQLALSPETIELIDGDNFPDGPTTIVVANLELSGTLTGSTFTIDSSIVLDFDTNDPYNSLIGEDNEPFGFIFIEGGTTVKLKTNAKISYIANILDSSVKSVQAFRQLGNGQKLVTISSSLYTVKKETSGPYTFTIIEFAKPLSSLDEKLSDDIFVTLESPIGPNTVSIMVWLIDTYTDLSYDPATFTAVKIKIENYPSHFAMLERKDIMTMLEEMALQARCAIWISNGVFFIKYLAEEVDENATITESDIDVGSLVVESTQTEEVVTKLTATWFDDLSETDPHTLILRHNIKKYGTKERELNFYIYNIAELVVKSATFWLIRWANVWKLISFDTYIHNLALESFDTIKFDFAQNFIADSAVKALVTDVTFNTSDHLLNIKAWVPVRFGEMQQYPFSWPSQIPVEIDFPTNNDILEQFAGGAGPGVDVEQEDLTNPTSKQFPTITITGEKGKRDHRKDYGEENPSDIGDIKPIPKFKGVAFESGDNPNFIYAFGGDYSVTLDTSTGSRRPGVFPGKIISEPSNEEEFVIYSVEVYTRTINGKPINRIVILLGDDPEILPKDTWISVMKNFQPTIGIPSSKDYLNDDIKREEGLNGDKFEWTMAAAVPSSSVFSGKIIGIIDINITPQVYLVEIYIEGLENPPEEKKVIQLQGAVGEAIPLDTWVIVARTTPAEKDKEEQGGEEEENPADNGDGFEWVMQVAVWL